MKERQRLYVTGKEPDLQFVLAPSLKEACEKLSAEARVPDSDEVRRFWATSGILKMSAKARQEKFNVSRQTIANWRRKGGRDLRTLPMQRKHEHRTKFIEVYEALGLLPLSHMKEATGLSVRTLHKIVKEMGLAFPSGKAAVLTNDELLKLAVGKTWQEFAKAAGLKLAVLRQRVYADPVLSAKVREVRKAAKPPQGKKGRVKVSLLKIKAMGHKGVSAYRIAEILGVEMMSVRYHLKKMGKEHPDEFYPPYGHKRKTGEPVDGSDGGSADHEG